MYQYIDGNLAISVNDWTAAGLTYAQFNHDSKSGYLQIARRGIKGNTLIWFDSIKRPERMRAIEAVLGKAHAERSGIYSVVMSASARAFFSGYVKADGSRLDARQINEYTMKASLFEAMRSGLEKQQSVRAAAGKRLQKGEWLKQMLVWWQRECENEGGSAYGVVRSYTNTRSLERAFQQFLSEGYGSLIHKGIGSDNARKVSRSLKNLLVALYRMNDKPFASRVLELYREFMSGTTELYDKQTGEVYRPQDFMHKGKAEELSESTVWNYLKDVVDNTAIYSDRNGHFDYQNARRPKHHRKLGEYSLSKISMDDVALSRKIIGKNGKEGWLYKYIAVDVVSGYYFRPAYVVGKPNERTVYESFRNMFCELVSLGLPMPAELEVEHHLMSNIPWLDDVFSFVRFCQSPTEKRAEHNIRSLKWGTAKSMGHTRGRWYAKSEAYRAIRNKVDGDYTEPVYEWQQVFMDDLADIERHNNELHPLQKTYPGMTRRDVLMKMVNPNLKPIDMSYLLQFIGNVTETSVRNNDYCMVAQEEFELQDFECLKRLQPNNTKVTAYWLPNDEGSIERVYLYQDGRYIGEADNRRCYDYNENAAERTAEDERNMLHQQKRLAKFDKFIRTRREELPELGKTSAMTAEAVRSVPMDIVIEEHEQPRNYEEDEFNSTDYTAMALNSL
ncbi:MAG: hypothetical protein IJS05_06495 [Paludibacteraceae bacterium]|nr:hypothetical protein [Paludibacteraceae bacterium]